MGTAVWQFQDEVAVVTGSSSGIGLATAQALVEAGARVHGLDQSEAAPDLCEDRYTHHTIDLEDGERLQGLIRQIAEDAGRLDHLILVAGITGDRALWNLDEATWEKVLSVNVSSAFRALKASAPILRSAGRGQVVAVASINGLRGKFGQAAYGASKAALINLMRVAARELGPKGVRVNCIAPGMVDTPMARAAGDEVVQRAAQSACLGRIAQPDEVAESILYLLSDASAIVTGATLVADAGQLA